MSALMPLRITAPVAAVSTADIKAHLRIDHPDDDSLLDSCVAVATAVLDGYAGKLGRAIVTQRWRAFFGGWGQWRCFHLPLPPLRSGAGAAPVVQYRQESDGVLQTLDAAHVLGVYDSAEGPMLMLVSDIILPDLYDAPDSVQVEYACGYGAPADVPADIIGLIKVLAAEFYRNPDQMTDSRSSNAAFVNRIVSNHRIVTV